MGIKRIQCIIGSLLYYAQAVDNKLLATLSAISSQQEKATENTAKAVNQHLDYVATYPSDGITYHARDMILAAHSDAVFSQKPVHAVEWVHTSSCPRMTQFPETMDRYSPFPTSSNSSWPQLQKQNLLRFTPQPGK